MSVVPTPIEHVAPSRRSYWTVWTATVLFFAGFYALLTPLPRYLVAIGLPDWQIGFILGAFGVAALVGRPLAGRTTDRLGARPVMLAGAASLMLGSLGPTATTSVAVLFGLRLLQAVGYIAFTTAGTALVVTLSAPEERGRRLAMFGAAANVAITLTPAAVSLLLARFPISAGFWVSAALALAAGGLAWQLPPVRVGAPGSVGSGLLFPRRLWVPMVCAGLMGVGFIAFFQYVPLLVERRGTLDAGWLYTTYGIGLIGSRFGAGGLVDRLSAARMLAITALLMATGLALFSVARTPVWLLAATLLVAMSGLFHPTLLALHAALLPDAPGRASAAFYVGFDLGIGLGGWLLGATLELAGVTGLYVVAALVVVCVLPLVPSLKQSANARE